MNLNVTRKFRVESLGCKVNQYDSQRIREALVGAGFCAASSCDEHVDVLVVNTCSVTHTADRKCRQLVRKVAREHPTARIYVTGCYATYAPQALRTIEGVDEVFPRADYTEMVNCISAGEFADAESNSDFGIQQFPGKSRAFVKVQDGCDFYCSYCIIPYLRGRPRSRPVEDAVREARCLLDSGYREVVLTGIHLGLYGRDLPGKPDLAEVVSRLADTGHGGRVRLSSIEGMEVSDDLLETMGHPSVCPHLHLPLQSGDDDVLYRMGRHYTTEKFLDVVRRAREKLQCPAITTDVMVGFPGETDKEFNNTLQLCREINFSRIHVFKYSPRKGTPAAEMRGQVHSKVTNKRSRELRRLANEMSARWAEKFVGGHVRVLLEENTGDGVFSGYTDRYVRALVDSERCCEGEMKSVLVEDVEGGNLRGTALQSD